MPEDLRLALLERGHLRIEIGDMRMSLGTGIITRAILLDGVEKTRAIFPTGEIDWGIVAKAIDADAG